MLWNHLQNSLFAKANKWIQTFFDVTRRAQLWLETQVCWATFNYKLEDKKNTTTGWHNLFFNNNLSNKITPHSAEIKNLVCLNTNQAYWKASNAFANLFFSIIQHTQLHTVNKVLPWSLSSGGKMHSFQYSKTEDTNDEITVFWTLRSRVKQWIRMRKALWFNVKKLYLVKRIEFPV